MEDIEPTSTVRSPFGRRLLGAATFSVPIYEEVEHDADATLQAAGVVGLVAVAAALGGIQSGPGGLLAGVFSAYLGWALWSGTCYLVGVQLFEGTASWGELLRTIGFAMAPGALLVLGILPLVGGLLHIVILLWMVGTVFTAIRQALDFDNAKAVFTALAGFVPYMLARLAIELMVGITPSVLP